MGKKFEINTPEKEIKINNIMEDFVIDNGKFKVRIDAKKFNEVCDDKKIPTEEREEIWNIMLKFNADVKKEKFNNISLGSTEADYAIQYEILTKYGGKTFSVEDVQKFVIDTN